MKNINEIRKVRYPTGFLRIQKSEDFKKFSEEKSYKNCRQGESRFYRVCMKNKAGKMVGETIEISGYGIEAENKGYPKGFKNYDTYDQKYRPRNKTIKNY